MTPTGDAAGAAAAEATPLFHVLCRIDETQRDLMRSLRTEHLEFAVARRESIRYGGFLAGDHGPQALLYVVALETIDDVREWVGADPYCGVYTAVEISPFVQRVPEAFPGELEQVLAAARDGMG